jgi:putative transposase
VGATTDVCRASAGASFYKWEAKYGGMEVSEAQRLKALEDENAKLRKLSAGEMPDNPMKQENGDFGDRRLPW